MKTNKIKAEKKINSILNTIFVKNIKILFISFIVIASVFSFFSSPNSASAIDYYTLTMPASGGTGSGAYSGASAGSYPAGTSISITAIPTYSTFVGWTASGSASACNGLITNPCTFTLNANTSIQANYTLGYLLVVARNGAGNDAGPSGYYAVGTVVSLINSPAPGWYFTGYTGDSGCSTGSVTMTSSGINCTANFVPNTVTVNKTGTGTGTVTSNAGGINCGSTCDTGSNLLGTSVTLTATPDAHSTFTGWSGGGCSGTGTCTVDPASSSITVTAVFTIDTNTVSTSGSNVTFTPTSRSVGYGSTTTFNVSPDSGYHIVSVSGCNGSFADPTYTTDTITAPCTVTATTAVYYYTLTITANGGTMGGTTAGSKAYGSAISITQTPPTGYTFTGWSSTGSVCTGTGTCAFSMPGDAVTVVANYTGNNYDYTFDSNGGTPTYTTVNQAYGSTVVSPGSPTKTGYTFTGWSPSLPISMPLNGGSSTAQYTINPYTLTIPASTGTGSGSYGGTSAGSVNYGTSVSITATPAASSNFTSWTATGAAASSCNGTTTSPCVFNMTGVASVTAVYTLKSYTLTYSANANGSLTGTASQNVNYGANGTAVTAVPSANYHFTSWSDSSTSNPRTDTNITANLTVSASFAIDTKTLTVNNSGNGTGGGAGTYNYGSVVTLTSSPSANYHLSSWTGDADCSDGSVTMTTNVTCTANFAIDQKTLTINTNGGTGTGTSTSAGTYNYGTVVTLANTPAASSNFVSWGGDADCNDGSVTMTTDVTCTARFDLKSYTLTYSANANGSLTGTASQNVNYGANGTAVTAVPSANYHFTSWSDSSTSNPRTDTNITANLTVSASFAIDTKTLTVNNSGNGTGGGAGTYNYGSVVTLTSSPSANYHLSSWTGDADCSDGSVTMTTNVTCTANFAIDQKTVATSGSNVTFTPTSRSVDYGNSTTFNVAPTTGYHIVSVSGCNGSFADPTYTTGAITTGCTVTATTAVNIYTITFDENGGDTPANPTTRNADYNTTVTLPTEPTKTGYTFGTWNTLANGSGSTFNASTPVTSSYTVYAKWNAPNEYDYSFDSDGGTPTYTTVTQAFESAVVSPGSPTKTGYTFTGWSPALPTTMPLGGGSSTAQYTINSNTLSITANGGTMGGTTAGSKNYGTAISITQTPGTGYTFSGWTSTGSVCTGTGTCAFSMPDNAVTVVANYTINSYTITFDSVGGSAVTAITQNYNTTITPPASPTKTGYTFTSWSPAIPATMPATDQTITATWTINSYTYTFAGNGATVEASPSSVTQNYGTVISLPTSPTRTGYTFTSWSPSIPATMPVDGGTSSAQWSINSHTLSITANGGTMGGTTAGSKTYGTAISITQTTPTGYTFTGWSSTSSICTGTGTCAFSMPDNAVTVVANYTISNVIPTVISPTSSSITPISAILGAEVTSLGIPASISARGICIGLSASPTSCTADGVTTLGLISMLASSLTPDTLYYYRGYAINETGPAYSTDGTFTTLSLSLPIIITQPSNKTTSTSSTAYGEIISYGNELDDTRGMVYDTVSHSSPGNIAPSSSLYGDNISETGSFGVGTFSLNMSGLTANTKYYIRAYSHNTTGYSYGDEISFTTTNSRSRGGGSHTESNVTPSIIQTGGVNGGGSNTESPTTPAPSNTGGGNQGGGGNLE